MTEAGAENKTKYILTREKLIGMQVVGPDGYIVGKVKELSLVVGESDQALILQDDKGNEDIIRWSDVMAAGDVILLKPPNGSAPAAATQNTANVSATTPAKCPNCGAPLDPGTIFCTSCGHRLTN